MTPTLHARRLFAAALLAVTWPVTATAHDFFLLPGAFVAKPTETVSLNATVSAAFPKVETAVSRDRLSATTTAGAANSGPLQASSDGKLQFTVGGPGIAMAAASVAAREVDYPEATLDVILKEYDIEGPAAAAAKALPRPRTLKVISRRFAKTLICVDGCRDQSGAAARAGYALEFVATDLEQGQFTLLADGRPLANHPVAVARGGNRQSMRTDGQGRVSLPVVTGPVMLFAAAMSPPATPGGRFDLRLTSLTLGR